MSDESLGQESTDEASHAEQRRAALRALAQTTQAAPAAAPPAASPSYAAQVTPAQRPNRRIALVAISLLVVVAVAAGVAAHLAGWPHGSASATTKPIVRIALANDNVACVSSVEWSPNSEYVAVIGQGGACNMSTEQSPTDVILIYDARSGKLLQRLHPDTAIFGNAAIKQFIKTNTTSSDMSANVTYWTFTWTPDNASLVAPFAVSIQSTTPVENGVQRSSVTSGILSVRVNGAASTTTWMNPNHYQQNHTTPRWDLTNGSYAEVPEVPAATAYRWNTDGSLTPIDSAKNQPIGNPVGGQTFTIWQPGTLYRPANLGQVGQGTPMFTAIDDIIWSASLSAVSPDGRYYYPTLDGYGSLVPPSTQQFDSRSEPLLRPRDHALLLIAESMLQEPAQPSESQPATLVAWRPDGKLLASVTRFDGGSVSGGVSGGGGALAVNIGDTASGHVVTRLIPKVDDLPSSTQTPESLAWSPDGSRLLLLEPVYGVLTIWGPGALPK